MWTSWGGHPGFLNMTVLSENSADCNYLGKRALCVSSSVAMGRRRNNTVITGAQTLGRRIEYWRATGGD